VEAALDQLLELDGITLVIGHPARMGAERFNAATVLRDGHRLGQYHKMLLPNHEVFDECRYFTPGVAPLVVEVDGVKLGVLICEDVWHVEPAAEAAEAGADCLVVLNASPFHRDKIDARQQTARYRVEETGLPLAYVNLTGGQDELVFDGASFALNRAGQVAVQLPAYDDALGWVDYADGDFVAGQQAALPEQEESVYRALVIGVRDYIGKNGFPGVLLGLSGGIDSALTLAVAVDALGADKVHAVMMPSPYTADISLIDSRDMVARLGVPYDELAISPMYDAFEATLAPLFAGRPVDTTEENLQSRIRGVLLMALSNKTGKLVLTTGNKSEMTTGYATLYGDMARFCRAQGRGQDPGVRAVALAQYGQRGDPGAHHHPPAVRRAAPGSERPGQPAGIRRAGRHHAALCRGQPVCRADYRGRLSGGRCAQGGAPAENQRIQAPPGPGGSAHHPARLWPRLAVSDHQSLQLSLACCLLYSKWVAWKERNASVARSGHIWAPACAGATVVWGIRTGTGLRGMMAQRTFAGASRPRLIFYR